MAQMDLDRMRSDAESVGSFLSVASDSHMGKYLRLSLRENGITTFRPAFFQDPSSAC